MKQAIWEAIRAMLIFGGLTAIGIAIQEIVLYIHDRRKKSRK